MKILLVNGSPRPSGESSSGLVLETIKARLPLEAEVTEVTIRTGVIAQREYLDMDAIVLAFPLYVDSLPAPVLEWLISFEDLPRGRGKTGLWAICNCGFHEGVQTRPALRIVRNFCVRQGILWQGGLGIGTGGMLQGLKAVPDGAWIKKPVSSRISAVVAALLDWCALDSDARRPTDRAFDSSVHYTQFAFPRFLYILAAHSGWRKSAKDNGLKARDLYARPIAQD